MRINEKYDKQNIQTPFVCDRIMKKALVTASKTMNTSQSKVIQLALSQFLRIFIDEEIRKSFLKNNEEKR